MDYMQKFKPTNKYMLIYSVKTNVCELVKMKMYDSVVASSNLPPSPVPCPFPKVDFSILLTRIFINIFLSKQGNYELKDYTIDESSFPKVLPTGENYVELLITIDNHVVSKTRLYTDIKKA